MACREMAGDNDKRPDLYAHAQALISRAYQLPELERDGFIERECQANVSLRQEVAWLLDVLQSPDDGFMNKPLNPGQPDVAELKVPTPRNYTLLRQLGEGGMGIVFLAERVDGEFRHRVALKLLNVLALQSQSVLSRFLAERQILARLNHPNISHLVDAGALADGRPFLAMEYVDGIRIDHHCAEQRLSVPQRLALFLKVCAAVHYAHQQLIIHRDIKPANVLVTADGEPKLLDFGIARLIESPNSAMADTVGSPRMMTLAYASPEQILGKPLSTATDEYSLAVVLYELLAGTHPWGDEGDPDDIVRAVSRSEPLAPSVALRRRVTTLQGATYLRWLRRSRSRDLSKDLDAIVLKALSKRMEDRYASVSDFADDITAYLKGLPVKARNAHAWYSMRKFIGRHRIGMAVTALVLTLSVAFTIDRQFQLERTRQERERAQSVADLMTSMFRSTDPNTVADPNTSAREVLDRAAQNIADNPKMQADTRATLLFAIGKAYSGLGVTDSAKKAFDSSLALLRQQRDVEPENMVDMLAEIGGFYDKALGDARTGEALEREAVDLARRDLPAGNSVRTGTIGRLASDLVGAKQGVGGESERLARDAVKEAMDAGDFGSDEVISAQQELAFVLVSEGKLEEAEKIYQGILPPAEARYGTDSQTVLNMRNEFARILLSERKLDSVESLTKETLVRAERHFGADSPMVAMYWNSVADFYNRTNRLDDAADAMSRAVDLKSKGAGKDNPSIGQIVCNLAYSLIAVQRLDEAEKRAEECVRLRLLPQAELSGYHKAHAFYVLGQVKAAHKKPNEAHSAYERARKEIESDRDRNGRGLYLALDMALANLAIESGDAESAIVYADDYGRNGETMPDQPYIQARHAQLRAAAAALKNDRVAIAQWTRTGWQQLKEAKSNCVALLNALRKAASGLTAKELPDDFSTDPACTK